MREIVEPSWMTKTTREPKSWARRWTPSAFATTCAVSVWMWRAHVMSTALGIVCSPISAVNGADAVVPHAASTSSETEADVHHRILLVIDGRVSELDGHVRLRHTGAT